MNNKFQDLEVLSKYLDKSELKEIAKVVAYDAFKNNLGEQNPYAKTNIEYYIKHGAYQAVMQHATENCIEIERLSKDLSIKVEEIIKKIDKYDLPKTFNDLAIEILNEHKPTISKKMEELLQDFLEKDEYGNAYKTFSSCLGDYLGDLVNEIFREHFQSKKS